MYQNAEVKGHIYRAAPPSPTQLQDKEDSFGGHPPLWVTQFVHQLREQSLFLLRFLVEEVKDVAKGLLPHVGHRIMGQALAEGEGGG